MSMETYYGHVKTPQDAILLFEACRLGLLPRVQRRLSEKERQQIRSGSVFVWDEREAGMRRWTDGKSWSASRVSGSFLTYREMEGRRGNGFTNAASARKTPNKCLDGSRNGDSDQEGGEDGPDGYRYKPDGLMKQSFSITTSDGRHLHLISYYSRPPANSQPLKQPATDPSLRNIRPQKGMYPEATVNEASSIPPVTRGPMNGSPYSSAPPVGPPYPYSHVPQGYVPGYPPGTWPSSPANTPPAPYAPYHFGYPISAYPPAPYPSHMAPHYPPPPGPTQFDRAPPPPAQTNLPAPLHAANGHAPPAAPSYPPGSPPRVHTLPPYAQPSRAPSSLQPNPYSSSTIDARYDGNSQQQPPGAANEQPPNGAQNGYHGYHKPPTPPASSAGATPNEKQMQPEPLAPREVQNSHANGKSTPTKMIPSINALINGDSQTKGSGIGGDRAASRSGSRSPAAGQPVATELPDMMAQGGFQKGQSDLKRLDMQMFKF